MFKRDYYIRSCVREVEEDGVGIAVVGSFSSMAEAIDYRPGDIAGRDGKGYGGETIGKITFELYDDCRFGPESKIRVKKESLTKLLELFRLCLYSEFDEYFDTVGKEE